MEEEEEAWRWTMAWIRRNMYVGGGMEEKGK
jgi:hypothetical protein